MMIAAISVASVAGTIVLASFSNRPVDHFSRDPLAVMDAPAYLGLLSNLTAAAWFATAGAAWLIASALGAGDRPRRRSLAMTGAAAVLTVLGVDDLFMIHEELLQRHLGVPEVITFALYGLLVAALAFGFRDVWRSCPRSPLMLAAMLLGASLTVDVLTTGFGWRLLIEDGLKFLGVAALGAWMLAAGMTWLGAREVESSGDHKRGSMSARNTA